MTFNYYGNRLRKIDRVTRAAVVGAPEDKLLGSMTRVKKKGWEGETSETKTAAAASGNPEKSPVVLLRALFLEYSPPFSTEQNVPLIN